MPSGKPSTKPSRPEVSQPTLTPDAKLKLKQTREIKEAQKREEAEKHAAHILALKKAKQAPSKIKDMVQLDKKKAAATSPSELTAADGSPVDEASLEALAATSTKTFRKQKLDVVTMVPKGYEGLCEDDNVPKSRPRMLGAVGKVLSINRGIRHMAAGVERLEAAELMKTLMQDRGESSEVTGATVRTPLTEAEMRSTVIELTAQCRRELGEATFARARKLLMDSFQSEDAGDGEPLSLGPCCLVVWLYFLMGVCVCRCIQ